MSAGPHAAADHVGRVALVTGAASGIGLAAVEHLIRAGSRVVAVDLDAAGLDGLARFGDRVVAVRADVSEAESAEAYVRATLDRFGRLDAAILNAGIIGPIRPIAETTPADFDRVMAVNVRGVWLALAALLPAMRGRGGSIVVTASTGGLRGAAGLAPYVASKHAVLGLVKSAALEGARHGIRVNAVCPGPVDTPMYAAIEAASGAEPAAARAATNARIPLGRAASVDDVARMMLFLAGQDSAFATGGAYLLDGGLMAGAT